MEVPVLKTTSLSEEQKKGWLMVGEAKGALLRKQQAVSLELQEVLLHPGTTISEIEASLARYRKIYNDQLVGEGQKFRAVITDKVLKPSLAIEKQYNPKEYEDYLRVENTLLNKKIEQDKQNRTVQAKEQEKSMYRTHVRNQYEHQIADYKQRCVAEVNTMKLSYLKGKIEHPDTRAIKETLMEFKLAPAQKFTAQYITDDEKKEIFVTIPKPDLKALQQEMLEYCDDQFRTYAQDLRAGAVDQVELFAAQEIQQIEQEKEINVGVNNLAGMAVDVPGVMMEGKALRRTVEVVIESTETWAVYVMTAFLRTPLCRVYVTVKAWENLTVKQMSVALGKWSSESGEVDQNLQYREVVK